MIKKKLVITHTLPTVFAVSSVYICLLGPVYIRDCVSRKLTFVKSTLLLLLKHLLPFAIPSSEYRVPFYRICYTKEGILTAPSVICMGIISSSANREQANTIDDNLER